ncbi:uncharacterized protein LOC110375066 isoform X1 [Helicoverpa armigera]|uniref:uncharacterized protein LOC110375066 isoform X1 n=1 Tax=Helicoverpa armigera TaxID=29058 RepID=UPI002111B5A3|nr:uncharacterized protein LOC110375066 isoform X2 [Helicoverpa armigera]
MCCTPLNNKLVFVYQAVLLLPSSYSYVDGVTTKMAKKLPKNPPVWPNEPSVYSMPNLRKDNKEEEEASAIGGGKQAQADGAANRFSQAVITTTKKTRTTPSYVSVDEPCDYIALQCFRAFQTGRICARTVYNKYFTFKNYCMLLFTNCMERYEVWQATHMGACYKLKPNKKVHRENSKDSHIGDGYYWPNNY